jgi:tetratricopeptide (TPR) repeat protein
MADHSRIDDLRRRVEKDPASIAFAQLAEECRRAGAYQEAVETCRAGLEIHPGYLSARVTLGRALVELGLLDEAQAELSRVLESAPENLAAIRGLAEIYHRRGDLPQALAQYRAALLLARNDPDLEQTIADLSRQIEPAKPAPSGGLTLQHMQDELLKLAPPAPRLAPTPLPPLPSAAAARLETDNREAEAEPQAEPVPDHGVPLSADILADFVLQDGDGAPEAYAETPAGSPEVLPGSQQSPQGAQDMGSNDPAISADLAGSPEISPALQQSPDPMESNDPAIAPDLAVNVAPPAGDTLTAANDDRATRTVAALEQWLAAIHVPREPRHP